VQLHFPCHPAALKRSADTPASCLSSHTDSCPRPRLRRSLNCDKTLLACQHLLHVPTLASNSCVHGELARMYAAAHCICVSSGAGTGGCLPVCIFCLTYGLFLSSRRNAWREQTVIRAVAHPQGDAYLRERLQPGAVPAMPRSLSPQRESGAAGRRPSAPTATAVAEPPAMSDEKRVWLFFDTCCPDAGAGH